VASLAFFLYRIVLMAFFMLLAQKEARSLVLGGESAFNERMKNTPKSLVYFQSGGPTTVINSSLLGVIEEAKKHPEIGDILGSMYGVEGLIEDNLIDLRQEDQSDLDLLKHTPGAILGSTRRKLPALDDPLFEKIIWTIQKHNIGYVLVNGGNDSMDTCNVLSRFFEQKGLGVQVLGIPKTIDNDLAETDHSVGYPSAAKHVINTLAMIIDDAKAYQHGKVVLVEVMGRDSGWLTSSADLLPENRRPDLIYVPENGWDETAFLKDVQAVYEKKGYAVVALSEGMPIAHHNDCGEDSFGHHPLEGCSISLGHLLDKTLHLKNRSIELSIPCRADPYLRSPIDEEEACQVGRFALQALLNQQSGKMVSLVRETSLPYRSHCALKDVALIADKTIRMPQSYLLDNTRMSDAFRAYLTPLLGPDYLYPYPHLF
jgi:ATP-dependent phosphofructokinase / diphosphate-dependent phosphofructokinase